MTRVLIPWPDLDVPAGLPVEVYDGRGDFPASAGDVEFYVLPYDTYPKPFELLGRLPSLRAVQSLSAGVDKVRPLLPPGVQLCNGQGLHDLSVAEHAMALIHASQRDLPRWIRQQAAGVWSREHTRSLADSRVLLIGYGGIGQAISRQLLAAEAVVTPVASSARPGVHGISELASLLPSADIVVLILPDTASTRGLLGAAGLALLPDDALVVNVGRGSAVDTDALVAEASSGRLRAALDVMDPEPLPGDHPLWTIPGVILTPHVAGGSASFYPRAKRLVEEQLRRFSAGEPLLHVVKDS
ncbi:Phosphoglycerate dehydrogenase [Amycolatopsis xylanica]|uniref:Phosphoglycerate dehydrogenase n=1 Tax=Amycolatopsis xylanica TaxID=589385 RepID=A0A1H3SZ58_9PSEU|nr:2-hydroxyacid dehydrogenase [Amycolatopsis xylanica]SDZ43070.1 Phosphoglycerate dehydrogenase [Amycolatopsis xylanica]